MIQCSLDIRPEIAAALTAGQPVVALESTIISHGLPWPVNLETARASELAVRENGAIPATIAVIKGRLTVGLRDDELEAIAKTDGVMKASRRDLATAVAQSRIAGTTVSATMFIAHRAGIRVFATGGIGGAHRGVYNTWDISADLIELARTPVTVVCAGAKSILDIARTLEILETHGVPVVGLGTDEFPAFYTRISGRPVSARVDTPRDAARLISAYWTLGGAGVVIAQPIAEAVAIDISELTRATQQAEADAEAAGVRGSALTPFLLQRLAALTNGRTSRANRQLMIANAGLAARIGRELLA